MRTKNAKVTEIIYDLLVNDKVALADDIYLYGKVIKALVSGLLDKSFGDVLINYFNNGFIHFETVRRTRAAIQSEHPELIDETTYKKCKKFHERYIKNLITG